MLIVQELLIKLFLMIQMVTSLGLSVESFEIDGYKEKTYTVVANPLEVEINQRISFDEIYGFQTLDDMAKEGEVGINGMFYNDIGRPAGILIIDGNLVKKQSINTPLFIIRDNGQMEMVEPLLRTFLKHEDESYEVYEVNEGLTNTLIGVFTKWYGPHNRRKELHTVINVEDSEVVEVFKSESIVAISTDLNTINDGDFMVCHKELRYDFDVNVGDRLSFTIEDNFDYETVDQAFQTGGWLVKDGENVAKDYENYIGGTDSLQPRTAIGITKDNKLVLKVADGRNKEVSVGVNGNQMAELMIKEGCVFAAYLDGGASSTLVVDKQVVNEPSLGQSKAIAHGIFLYRDIK